jgi:hypothetical protein
MTSVATQSLLGQSADVVEGVLGSPRFHQPNSANQTDLYVYSPTYLRDIFPVLTTGIIGVYRNNLCIALKVVFSKTDYHYENFIFNREIASRLFDRVIGGGYAYWQEIEAEPRDGGLTHYVYCMGNRVATTWDASAQDGTIASDVSIFLDSRCEPNDDSDLNQPITTPPPAISSDLPFVRPTPTVPTLPDQELPTAGEPLEFPDIDGNLYETEILKAANTYHIISGYEDGTFKPTNAITREQGLAMLINAIQELARDDGAIVIPDDLTEPPFEDVPIDHKSAGQFYYAKENGILSGDEMDRAHPDSSMSRAELIAMVNGGLQVVVELNYTPTTTPGEVVEPIKSPVQFSDIGNHWGKAVIREMGTYGIASPLNETGNQFAPATEAQRDYTAAALVRLMELKFRSSPGGETKPKPVKVFPDIADNIYKEEILKAANTYSIVSGYEDGKFHPLDELSREQAVVILVNAMEYLVKDASAIQIPETLSDPPPFPDVKAGGSATKIQFAKEAGLIRGDDLGNFRPLDKISRAEVMAMIHKGLEFVVEANFGQPMALSEAIKPSQTPTAEFSDVASDHWVSDSLAPLRRFGIATPLNEEGTAFKPDQSCLRDYAAAAMVRMDEVEFNVVDITPKPETPISFSDISGNPYEDEILRAANTYHLVAGYEDGTFRPTAPTTREQAVAMLVDSLGEKVINEEAVKVPDHLAQPPFLDVDINRWSATKIYFAKRAGIVSGDELGRFNPEAQVSRAQLVAMADQALRYAIWADLRKNNMPLDQVMALDGVETYSFDDIPSDHWGRAAVTEMGNIGLALPAKVSEPAKFVPNSMASRDFTVATCVHLIEAAYSEGSATEPPGEIPFIDIASSPYAQEIGRAVNPYKIVSGTDDGLFHPAESISREHLVAMLVKGLQQLVEAEEINIPDKVEVDPFEDVPAESLFAPQIKFISDVKIMRGDEGTNLFRPKNDLTRAELMAVVNNALNFVVKKRYGDDVSLTNVVDLGNGVQFTDIDNHWAEATIQLMAQLDIAQPREQGQSTFEPNKPSRRDYATASMVNMLEVPFTV